LDDWIEVGVFARQSGESERTEKPLYLERKRITQASGKFTMTVDAIAGLTVPAEDDAHLYLWTTQRYLWDAPKVVRAWGFEPSTLLTWCKPPTGFSLGGTFGKASEFVLFARRGRLAAKTRVPRDWWEWSRGAHSAKPEAFLDIVESVSPGPYLELFARRNRLGWGSRLGPAQVQKKIDENVSLHYRCRLYRHPSSCPRNG
jgi:N6-adenosine-specific RNA methylase IME4